MKTKYILFIVIFIGIISVWVGCQQYEGTSDQKMATSQEKVTGELNATIGLPAIVNGFEKRQLKDILEMRDNPQLVTYSYIFCQMTGKYVYLGRSIGYGIPYATQYTNPVKPVFTGSQGIAIIAQADPNGLFQPSSAAGTWVLLIDEKTGKPVPAYIEDNVSVFQFQLPARLVQ